MTIEITGRQTDVVPQVRALAERKLAKLARVLPGITHAHVVLGVDRHRESAEVSVQSPHLSLSASEVSGDMAQSVATVIDKLTRQAQRHLGKWRGRKRRVPRETAAWEGLLAQRGGNGDGGARPRVVRSRRFLVKPMTVDEAVLEVGGNEDGVVVFRDAATERVNVLYRRKDGNLGLIEPEA